MARAGNATGAARQHVPRSSRTRYVALTPDRHRTLSDRRRCCGRTCVRRTDVRYSRDGLQQPVVDVGRARSCAVGARRTRWARRRQPVVERRWRRAGVEPASPAVRGVRHARGGRRPLCRAPLPLQLLVPRRRVAPRGARHRSRPARPRSARRHRSQRVLRGGALRRGGPGGRHPHRVRHRDHAHPGSRRPPASRARRGRHAAPGEHRRAPRLDTPPTRPVVTSCYSPTAPPDTGASPRP